MITLTKSELYFLKGGDNPPNEDNEGIDIDLPDL